MVIVTDMLLYLLGFSHMMLKAQMYWIWRLSRFLQWSLSAYLSSPLHITSLLTPRERIGSVMGDPDLLLFFPLSNKADNHLFPNHISMPVMRGVSQPLEYDP